MGIQIETVRTNTFEMNYFHFGTGEKPFVILPGLSLKSVMGAADAIAGAYRKFTDEYTVYVMDRRSQLPPVYPIRNMARDTALAVRGLGLQHVFLFGTSQGGMIAQCIAADHPDLAAKLVLGSTAAHTPEHSAEVVRNWIRLAGEKKTTELNRNFAEMVYTENFFRQYKDLILAAGEGVSNEDLERFMILARGIEEFDITGDLHRISCPVLVLGAGKDRIFGPETSEEIAEKIGCSCYIYKEYGHAVYDEAPDYQDRILEFLKE